ncbi:M16 family metallopeptidase [Bartonella sp. HY406]|uniref:M16 family metallopeptidase n=1 Tax=Bartonella sp. HY406 TaxID=2979331 RepID=UPI0021C737B0|nr:pitrilysin family protein [Bartonella sp. HY406]UXN03078.1 insulinase family protein [Bartonella sp. HY406]
MSGKFTKLALTAFMALSLGASTALASSINAPLTIAANTVNNPILGQQSDRISQVNEPATGAPSSTAPLVENAPNAVETNQQTEPSQSDQSQQVLPDIEKIGDAYRFTLENGLQVIVLPNHRAPVITQMVWYRAGSADENPGTTGIAHFLEHLMFKGTKTYPGDEFNQTVSRLGGQQNAFTSYDYTAYFQSVASQYIEEMMKREADRMLNLVLSEDDITSERQVIIEERRMRTDNSPAAMLSEESRATLFLNSPYHNPVIGWKQEMEALSREDVINFYHKFYTPNNATLILAGDITPEKARELSLATFGKLEKRSSPPQKRIRPQEPVSRTQRVVTMRDPRVSNESFQHLWVVPSYNNAKTGQAEALDLLGEILGGSQRSRLYTKFVVQEGKAASVGSGYSGVSVDDGIFYVYAMPRNNTTLEELQSEINEVIADIAKNGVSEAELNQARERFIRAIIYSQDSPSGLANIYGAALSTGQTLETIHEWPERLKKVTPEAIKEAAKAYLDGDKGVVSYLLPPKGEKPREDATSATPAMGTDESEQQ